MGISTEELIRRRSAMGPGIETVTFLPDPEPPEVWATIVSVDDHVVEPPDLFKDRLPKKYVDLAPQFLTKEDGTNVWSYEGTEVGNVALNAVAGRPKDEYGIEPTSFSDIRPGCYDVNERVKDMNANGVLGALCFPSFRSSAGSSSPGPTTRTWLWP